MKIFVKTIKIIVNIITTLIIIFGGLFIILFCFGIQPYVVESGSMEPTIKTGSVCFVNRRANYDEIKVGDIIAFKINSNDLATHRVNSITDYGIETKGDANDNVDGIITNRETFVGKNILSIPGVGFIIRDLQTTKGKIILGTFVVCLLVVGIFLGEPSKKKKGSELEKNK